jgi:predicted small secreted protein
MRRHPHGTLSATHWGRANPRKQGSTAMKRATALLVPLLSAAALTMLSACNTVEGVGRDVERAGNAIQDEADDAQDRRRRDD